MAGCRERNSDNNMLEIRCGHGPIWTVRIMLAVGMAMALVAPALVAPALVAHPPSVQRQLRSRVRGSEDPFRPKRPPIEPMIINAIQKLLSSDDENAAEVSAAALKVSAAIAALSLRLC